MGICFTTSTLPVIQNTQRPALPPGDVDAYQMARAGLCVNGGNGKMEKIESTNDRAETLREISQVQCDIYCDTFKKIEKTTGRKISNLQVFFGRPEEEPYVEYINAYYE